MANNILEDQWDIIDLIADKLRERYGNRPLKGDLETQVRTEIGVVLEEIISDMASKETSTNG